MVAVQPQRTLPQPNVKTCDIASDPRAQFQLILAIERDFADKLQQGVIGKLESVLKVRGVDANPTATVLEPRNVVQRVV